MITVPKESSMNAHVDLTNLRSMTDGDKEMEEALFEEFLSSFELGMKTLAANTNEGISETWRKEAHALKGIALSLGANNLGTLCKIAQDGYQTNSEAKHKILEDIEAEYEQVKLFLNKLRVQ